MTNNVDIANKWLNPINETSFTSRKAVGSFIYLALGQGGKIVGLILSTLILVRLLPPTDFGVAAIVAIVTNFLILFKDMGMTTMVIQQDKISQSQASTIFWVTQLVGVSFFLLFSSCSYLISSLFKMPDIYPAIIVVSLGFLAGSVGSMHEALMRRAVKFRAVALIDLFGVIFGIACSIALALWGAGWWSLVLQRIAQLLASSIGYWAFCSWRPSLRCDMGEAKEQIWFGFHIAFNNFSSYISRNSDKLIIALYWPPAIVGIYAKTYDLLVAPMNQVAGPIGSTLQSLLVRSRSDNTKYETLSLTALIWLAALGIPLASTIAVAPEAFVDVVLGPGWEAGASSARWLGLAMSMQLPGACLTWLLITQQRGKELAATTLINAAANALAYVLASPYGIGTVSAAYFFLGVVFRNSVLAYSIGRRGPITMMSIMKVYLGLYAVLGAFVASTWIVYKAMNTMLQIPEYIQLLTLLIFNTVLLVVLTAAVPSMRNSLKILLSSLKRSKGS